MSDDYDVIIIGSGFGGSISALRLTEKGYRVGVLEAGRRFSDDTFPKTSWRLHKYLWAPRLGLTGLQRIHILKDVVVLAGAGVGGGSLNYANTLYVPPKKFFEDRAWSHITDWAQELAPYYDQASRMLGVVENPTMTPADEVMKAVADEMGVGHTFRMTPVGVFFGEGHGIPAPDPFFGGAGPQRSGCIECGECMTGCRHNAKNTLPKNYLGLAESAGADVHPLTTVTRVRPRIGGGYDVDTERTGMLPGRRRRTFSAGQVIFAAGTYNTQRLLHRMKEQGYLHALSPALGRLSRTNSESILGAIAPDRERDFTRGVAITSSFYPEPQTHIEPVRYGKGSNSMGLLGTLLTDEEPGVPRWKTWAKAVARQPRTFVKLLDMRGWSERGVIALCMQPVDNSLTVFGKRGRFGRWSMSSRQGQGDPNPTWLPAANDAVRRMADNVDGIPAGNMGEVIGAPMTAHFVGGATISDMPDSGVVDPYQRVWGYDGLHVMDGSAVTANLGVNPSLTIAAQTERACSFWPNRDEPDPRPMQGETYRQVAPVEPQAPVVPAGAPAELRLPELAAAGAAAGNSAKGAAGGGNATRRVRKRRRKH
ncbi:MAG: GMC family oxidoreductase [Actinobacteria bacterium]|nr:GMC family oxidoreductase [Actinomycetota bacterium]